jgi:vitamin K-dependent gamma-carboxylase
MPEKLISNEYSIAIKARKILAQFLFKPVDIASLVFFRIAFGILAFADICGQWFYYHLHKNYFDASGFHFHYYGFQWVNPLPEPWMSLFFASLLLAATLIVLGKWYRVATLYFAFGFTYVFLSEKSLYLNHGYLFCHLSFLMALMPANRAFSWDVWSNPAKRLKQIPKWPITLLCFCMGVVYFYGGLAKLNPDWLRAIPVKYWLANKADMPLLGWLWKQELTAWIISWGGCLFDLSITFLLLNRRTRLWGFRLLILFHLTNLILFKIGIFPWLSTAISALFFPAYFPRQILAWLEKRAPVFRRWRLGWYKGMKKRSKGIKVNAIHYTPATRKWITALFIVYGLFHLSYPFRHHLIPGNVTWTEEGHRFSWRMMLRSKRGGGVFFLQNPETKEKKIIRPEEFLTRRQNRKLFGHPDMILEFAHYLRDQHKPQGWRDVEVYANISVSLNYRYHLKFIDSKTDLAKVNWSPWQTSPWINPFKDLGFSQVDAGESEESNSKAVEHAFHFDQLTN